MNHDENGEQNSILCPSLFTMQIPKMISRIRILQFEKEILKYAL